MLSAYVNQFELCKKVFCHFKNKQRNGLPKSIFASSYMVRKKVQVNGVSGDLWNLAPRERRNLSTQLLSWHQYSSTFGTCNTRSVNEKTRRCRSIKQGTTSLLFGPFPSLESLFYQQNSAWTNHAIRETSTRYRINELKRTRGWVTRFHRVTCLKRRQQTGT